MNELKRAYTIHSLTSTTKIIKCDKLERFFYHLHDTYDIICWQHQGVYRGKIEDHRIHWLPDMPHKATPSLESKYWQYARIFNDSEEYMIKLRGGQVLGRHRKDGVGAAIQIIKSSAILRSIVVSPELAKKEKTKECIRLVNYLDFDEVGKVKVCDMRFVGFKNISDEKG